MTEVITASHVPANTGPAEAKKFLYQIYYDLDSFEMLDPGFIPLDNTLNERPDWYELWVIRKFLKENTLEDGAWYGFLSPRFKHKTGFTSDYVLTVLDRIDEQADVALFSFGANVLAYYQNPFEHGEIHHPGLINATQHFLDTIGYDIDLKTLVTHSKTSVLCNYIVAKREYWIEWLKLADRFFEFVENGSSPALAAPIRHKDGLAPMKAFAQERFPSLILTRESFKIFALELSQQFVHADGETRRALIACDILKERFCTTNDSDFLSLYRKVRAQIGRQKEANDHRAPSREE